jgi:hypothetical protein
MKASRSGGVTTRSVADKAVATKGRLREFFYGVGAELCPHSITLDCDAVQVYTIALAAQAPLSALPIGSAPPQEQLTATRTPSAAFVSLTHTVLALVLASSSSCGDLLHANVAGLVHVTAVDAEAQKITILSPAPLPLPSSILLAGSIKWVSNG